VLVVKTMGIVVVAVFAVMAAVEYLDSDGAGYITIFAGQSAEVRARDYYDAIERGALNTRIADTQVVTPKKVVSFPQKRRRPVR
jgi:hypothetical protein